MCMHWQNHEHAQTWCMTRSQGSEVSTLVEICRGVELSLAALAKLLTISEFSILLIIGCVLLVSQTWEAKLIDMWSDLSVDLFFPTKLVAAFFQVWLLLPSLLSWTGLNLTEDRSFDAWMLVLEFEERIDSFFLLVEDEFPWCEDG